MTARKILEILSNNKIAFSVKSLAANGLIEKVVLEPSDISLIHDGAICICTLDYYNAIEGSYKNILYFLLEKDENARYLPADNLVTIQSDIDKVALFQMIDKHIHLNYRIDHAYSQIGQFILSDRDMQSLLSIGARLLGNPIVLLDISTKALCYSSREDFEVLEDELLQCVLKYGFVASELFHKYDYETLLPFIGAMEHAQFFPSHHEEKLNRLTTRVVVNNKYFGMLVVPEAKKTFESSDPLIADIISNGVSILLEKQRVTFAYDNTEKIFLELLSGSYTNAQELQQRAGGFNWDPHFPIRIAAIRPREKNRSQSLLSFRNHLSFILPATISAFYQDTMYLIVEKESEAYIRNTLSVFLKSNHLSAGLSCPFCDPLAIPQYASQAGNVLHIGSFLDEGSLIFDFEDYMFHYLAYTLIKEKCADFDVMQKLRKAKEYDKDYETDYCNSVRQWLYIRNLAETAKALNIHRNTIVYRLEKFQALTELDLASGDTIYKLNLAFHVLDLDGIEIE